MPGGTSRNWDSYGSKVSAVTAEQRVLLADPQTSGGLLVSVDEGATSQFEEFARNKGYALEPFGRLVQKSSHVIHIR